jgi:hypothetical protein
MVAGGQRHAQVIFLPRKQILYLLYRMLGEPLGRCGGVRKILSPPGFDPCKVQPVACRYTDWIIAVASYYLIGIHNKINQQNEQIIPFRNIKLIMYDAKFLGHILFLKVK